MSRTVIDVDDELLTSAMKEYGTTTKVETVNRALREVAERRTERLRRSSKIMDRISETMTDVDWDEVWEHRR